MGRKWASRDSLLCRFTNAQSVLREEIAKKGGNRDRGEIGGKLESKRESEE